MDNTCNYSDEWQPYIGDYDKYEYDVKLKDGRVIENCYPNAGKFNSISPEHDRQSFDENDVVEIRFSQKPRFGINGEVSNVDQYPDEDDFERVDIEMFPYHYLIQDMGIYEYALRTPYDSSNRKAYPGGIRLKTVEPKIPRNEPCPCGSGKKYKKCCITKEE